MERYREGSQDPRPLDHASNNRLGPLTPPGAFVPMPGGRSPGEAPYLRPQAELEPLTPLENRQSNPFRPQPEGQSFQPPTGQQTAWGQNQQRNPSMPGAAWTQNIWQAQPTPASAQPLYAAWGTGAPQAVPAGQAAPVFAWTQNFWHAGPAAIPAAQPVYPAQAALPAPPQTTPVFAWTQNYWPQPYMQEPVLWPTPAGQMMVYPPMRSSPAVGPWDPSATPWQPAPYPAGAAPTCAQKPENPLPEQTVRYQPVSKHSINDNSNRAFPPARLQTEWQPVPGQTIRYQPVQRSAKLPGAVWQPVPEQTIRYQPAEYQPEATQESWRTIPDRTMPYRPARRSLNPERRRGYSPAVRANVQEHPLSERQPIPGQTYAYWPDLGGAPNASAQLRQEPGVPAQSFRPMASASQAVASPQTAHPETPTSPDFTRMPIMPEPFVLQNSPASDSQTLRQSPMREPLPFSAFSERKTEPYGQSDGSQAEGGTTPALPLAQKAAEPGRQADVPPAEAEPMALHADEPEPSIPLENEPENGAERRRRAETYNPVQTTEPPQSGIPIPSLPIGLNIPLTPVQPRFDGATSARWAIRLAPFTADNQPVPCSPVCGSPERRNAEQAAVPEKKAEPLRGSQERSAWYQTPQTAATKTNTAAKPDDLAAAACLPKPETPLLRETRGARRPSMHLSVRRLKWIVAAAVLVALSMAGIQSGLLERVTTLITAAPIPLEGSQTVAAWPTDTPTAAVQEQGVAKLASADVSPSETTAPATLIFTLKTDSAATAVRLVTDDGEMLRATASSAPQDNGLFWRISTQIETAYTGKIHIFLRDSSGAWSEGDISCQVTVQ